MRTEKVNFDKQSVKLPEAFYETVKLLSDESALLVSFLQDLLTPDEFDNVTRRWIAILALMEGQTQRDAAELSGLETKTVNQWAKKLNDDIPDANTFRRVYELLGVDHCRRIIAILDRNKQKNS